MKFAIAVGLAAMSLSSTAPAATLAEGIQADMPQLMALYRDLHANPELSMQEVRTPAKLAAEVRKQCDRLVAVFSEDELLFIQWKRDAEAHVWLDGYEIGVKKNKKTLELVRGRHHPILDKKVPHERVHAICALLNDRDELSLALEYAGRARLIVDDIIAALAKYPEK